MLHHLTIKDWMTKDVITAGPNTSVRKAFYLIKGKSIRTLPIAVAGKLIGIVTDRDLRLPVSKLKNVHGLYQISDEIRVYEIMTKNVMTLSPNDSMQTAAIMAHKYRVSGFPVIDNIHDKHIVGIITTNDILRALVSLMEELKL